MNLGRLDLAGNAAVESNSNELEVRMGLDGPSRRIIVQPQEQPQEQPAIEPAPAESPVPDREKVPA